MKVKISLPNGVSFEGEKEDIRSLLDTSGYTKPDHKYYYSKSRGLVDVHDMDTQHLKNATLKIYREWVADLSKETDPVNLVKKIMGGPDSDEFNSLYAELCRRS